MQKQKSDVEKMVPDLKKKIRTSSESKMIQQFSIEHSFESNLDELLKLAPSKITLYFSEKNQHIDLHYLAKWNQ